jgi:hypothetical protein
MNCSALSICSSFSILICYLLLTSCVLTKRAPDNFLLILNQPSSKLDEKVIIDGSYTKVQKGNSFDNTFLDNPLFFFNNGLLLLFNSDNDSLGLISWMREYGTVKWSLNKWGAYEIKNDTIKAVIYINYKPKSKFIFSQLQASYFRGIVLNRDTIHQWQMIPPYPKLAVEYSPNQELFSYLKTPKDLFFKPYPITKFIDPEKAWVNKYRNERYIKRIKYKKLK